MATQNKGLNSNGTVWNFDDAESELVYNLKLNFIKLLSDWKLEESFFAFVTLFIECRAILSDTERRNMDIVFNNLSDYRNLYNQKKAHDGKEQGIQFMHLNMAYTDLCDYLKEHGLYFREKETIPGL